MSKSNTTENDMLKMALVGTDPTWRAGATIYLALYTADPGEAGTAITSETAYTNYARKAITKATGWTDGGSPTNGKIYYDFTTNDSTVLDISGNWSFWAYVVFSDGRIARGETANIQIYNEI